MCRVCSSEGAGLLLPIIDQAGNNGLGMNVEAAAGAVKYSHLVLL
jgi:hypothetical protein